VIFQRLIFFKHNCPARCAVKDFNGFPIGILVSRSTNSAAPTMDNWPTETILPGFWERMHGSIETLPLHIDRFHPASSVETTPPIPLPPLGSVCFAVWQRHATAATYHPLFPDSSTVGLVGDPACKENQTMVHQF
jgi:hypothetical protein